MPTLMLDCDGVLADTERFGHLPAFNAAFEDNGLPIQWTAEEYGELVRIGGGKERIRYYFEQYPQYRPKVGQNELDELIVQLHQAKTRKYIEIIENREITGRPGIRRLVDQTKDEGWTVAVASTSAVSSVQAVIDAVLAPGSVDAIFAGDSVRAKKPAPDIYLAAMSSLSADPQQTIVIEDSNTGATAAYNAGLRHIVTLSSFTRTEEFPHASLVVSDLGEPDELASLCEGPAGLLDGGMVTVRTLEEVMRA